MRSLKKNKLYPNPGPLSGGDIPDSAGDFSKMRKQWTPPRRDTIQDIEFEKAKAMFEQHRNPLSGNRQLYPEMPEPASPPRVEPQNTYQPSPPVANHPDLPPNHPSGTNPAPYPGGPTAQYPGYPPNQMFGGMYQAPMMDMWGNRHPSPYYPYSPMYSGYPAPYPPQHPNTPAPGHPVPQPPAPRPQEEAPPQQGCAVTGASSCGSNPADPLPGQPLKPVSSHGKSRLAPPPPSRPREEESLPVEQVSQLYPKLEDSVPDSRSEDPGIRRSFKRSSIRSVGGSMRNRASNRSVRFLESRREQIPVQIGRDINTLVKEADNDESIITPRTSVPETESQYPPDMSLSAENTPPLSKGDHISTLLASLNNSERISDVIERADSPPLERVEDTRYPNLRSMSEAILPTGDTSNFYPNLHEIQPRRKLRSSLRRKEEKEGGDTDEEVAEYTRLLTQEIMSSHSPTKPTTADLKRQLALEIEEAIQQKKLLRGDLRKRRPLLQRSLSENRARRPHFPTDNGPHSDDDWWSRKGRSRGPALKHQSYTNQSANYPPSSTDSSSSDSSSDSSDSTDSSDSSSDSSGSSVSLSEEFIMKKVKEYLARRKKNKQKREQEYYSHSSDSTESDEDVSARASNRSDKRSGGILSDSHEEGLMNTLAKHFRKGSTRLKRSVADSLAEERVLEKVILPRLHLDSPDDKHSVWDQLTNTKLDDQWEDKFKEEEEENQFRSEIEMLKHHLSEEEADGKENEHPNISARKPGFFSRILKKRPKYSFPRFAQLKQNEHDDEEEDEEVTTLSYIPSRENSFNKRREHSVERVPELALLKNRGFQSLQDIRDLNRELEHANDLVRANSLDFDLSKKPGQTATGYLTGHPLFKKLKKSLSGSLNRSGSLRSLFGSDRSRASNRSKVSEPGTYEHDIRDMNLHQLLDKYNPDFIKRSLENLG